MSNSMADIDLTQFDEHSLKALIEGKTDDEINEGIDLVGVDKALAAAFEGMKKVFDPKMADGQSVVLQYIIDSNDGEKFWVVTVKDGVCTVEEGEDDNPRATLELVLPDFFRILAGLVEPMMLFMSSKLRLQGDMMFAQTTQSWFPHQPESKK